MTNKVFCMAPFVHMYVTPTESDEKICCQANYHNKGNPDWNLERRWSNTDFQRIRQQMTDSPRVAEGEIAHLCSRCIEQESAGVASDRTMFNENYQHIITDIVHGNSLHSPLDLDLRPSNLCNLQCRMCNSSASSQIQKEIAVSSGLINFMGDELIVQADGFTPENMDFLLKNISPSDGSFSRIKFLGGEPTIMPEVHHILDTLIDKKLTDVLINITTNLTNVNASFLRKLEKFPNLFVQYSLDGTGKTLEYIRYPVKWDTIQKNIKIWQGVTDNDTINYTLQAYNVHNLGEFIGWANSINTHYNINMVWSDWDNIYQLPYEYRKHHLQSVDSKIIQHLLHDTTEYSIHKFVRHTKILDQSRNQHIGDYIPELWKLIKSKYN
jgi:sulfatase maturation enzyme AslB (radical SAM superfamily)